MNPDVYALFIKELLRQKQKEAPAWYQLRCVGLALVRAAETVGGDAAKDLGSYPVSINVPCRSCGKLLTIERRINDFGPITYECECGTKLNIS